MRVLAFACRRVDSTAVSLADENGLNFLGLIAMMDPPREESKAAVAECIRAGIRPIMITGDHKITAAAIAREIGILCDGTEAVEGAVIDKMSDEELRDFVPQVSVYARVSPEHKIRIVRAWQQRGNLVAMTGDGVNDAPALKQADIGVAMGITGTEVAKDAAGMVLADDNFATIVKAVKNGRNVYANIKRAVQFLLSGNTAGILTVLYASLMGLPVPFSAVHLLFINLLTDSLPAIALGLEPHTDEVMREKPCPRNEDIDDPVFGHMEYRHRWFKTDEYEMFGKKWTLTVAAKAYSGKPITDAERASYQKFQENQQETLALLSQKVTDYINNNLEELRFNWPAAKKVQDVSALSAIIMPTSLLFKQDGTTLMLFECVWDSDAGFAVQIYPDWEMGRQDLFL